jgi:hypothetical protein
MNEEKPSVSADVIDYIEQPETPRPPGGGLLSKSCCISVS